MYRFFIVFFITYLYLFSFSLHLFAQSSSHFPWKLGKKYIYIFKKDNKDVGFSTFIVNVETIDKNKVYVIKEKLSIVSNKFKQLGKSILYTDLNGMPIRYEKDVEYNFPEIPFRSGKYHMISIFSKEKVSSEITKDGKPFWKGDIYLFEPVFCFDNNFIGKFSFLLSMVNLKDKKTVIKVFNFDTMAVKEIWLKKERSKKVKVNGNIYRCNIMKMFLNGIKIGYLWITEKGQLLVDVEKDGRLVITITNP